MFGEFVLHALNIGIIWEAGALVMAEFAAVTDDRFLLVNMSVWRTVEEARASGFFS